MAYRKLGRWDRSIVASVFYDPIVKKIWFQLDRLCIEGKQLDVVAKLIKEEKIKCYGDTPKSILKGRDAQYTFPTNVLYLSPKITLRKLTVVMESAILHEGVHAYIDYKKLKKTTFFHNEAAAYVTQGLFLRQKGTKWPAHIQNDPIIKAVEDLINKFKMTSNKAWLNWVHFEPLMRAIQAHSTYIMKQRLQMPWGTKTPADGIAKKEVTGGSVSKRALAAKQPGPLGRDSLVPDSSQSPGPLGRA